MTSDILYQSEWAANLINSLSPNQASTINSQSFILKEHLV